MKLFKNSFRGILLLAIALSTMSAFPVSKKSESIIVSIEKATMPSIYTEAVPVPLLPDNGNVVSNSSSNSSKILSTEVNSKKTELSKKQMNKLQRLIAKVESGGTKSWVAAILLCFFLGTLGIHRFYLGYTWQGIVQLLTLGGFGIWTLIDFIRIIIKDLQPKDGSYDK